MSETDQDAIIGRTLREYSDARKALAVLFAEAESIGNELTGVGHALRTHHSLSGVAGYSAFEPAKFPTVEQLLTLAREIRITTENKNRLEKHLRDAGHDVSKD